MAQACAVHAVVWAGLMAGAVGMTMTVENDLEVGSNKSIVWVNSLRSTTEFVPMGYYSVYPEPEGVFENPDESLGQLLSGDAVKSSSYIFTVLTNTTCQTAVKKVGLTDDQVKVMRKMIMTNYRVNMIYEGMDLLQCNSQDSDPGHCIDKARTLYTRFVKGITVGERKNGKIYLHNHIDFEIHYNTPTPGRGITQKANDAKAPSSVFVAGFWARPRSQAACVGKDEKKPAKMVELKKGAKLQMTYSVTWVQKKRLTWGNRFLEYLELLDTDTEELKSTIIHAIVIVLFLSGIVAVILMRTLHLDFNRYNNPDNEEEMQEEVGWKLVHSDVFRPPSHPGRFCAVIGTGVQVSGMTGCALLLAVIGFMSPGLRGKLFTIVIFIFACLAMANGYMCARLQMLFDCRQWKTPILSGLVYPGCIFLIWGITECFLSSRHSTSAVGVSSLFLIVAQWWGLSIPLVILGAASGFKKTPMKPPIRYKSIARPIPPQNWIFSTPATILVPGIVTFVPVYVVFRVIMGSIWQGGVRVMFGYVFLISLLGLVLVAETTIVVIYYTLVYENYKWWWKSVIATSGVGVYFFLWSMSFMLGLKIKTWLSYWIFMCFSAVMAATIVLITGTIGFFSSWLFVCRIYNAIKIE